MRKKTPKLYDFFGTGKENIAGSESSDFIERKTKKRDKKAKTKKINLLKEKKEEVAGENEKRKVPLGVSVFDLIMPWKSDVVGQDTYQQSKIPFTLVNFKFEFRITHHLISLNSKKSL